MGEPRGTPMDILNTNHILPCSHCVAAALLLPAIYHLMAPYKSDLSTTLTLPLIVVIAPTLLLMLKGQ